MTANFEKQLRITKKNSNIIIPSLSQNSGTIQMTQSGLLGLNIAKINANTVAVVCAKGAPSSTSELFIIRIVDNEPIVLNSDNVLIAGLDGLAGSSSVSSVVAVDEDTLAILCKFTATNRAAIYIINTQDFSTPYLENGAFLLETELSIGAPREITIVKVDSSTIATSFKDDGDASDRNPLKIIDISNKTKPVLLNSGSDLLGDLSSGATNSIDMVLIDSNTLAILYKDYGNSGETNELKIIDITTRSSPSVINTGIDMDGDLSAGSGGANSLALIDSDTLAAVYSDGDNSGRGEIKIIDITTRTDPNVVNTTDLSGVLTSGMLSYSQIIKVDNRSDIFAVLYQYIITV